eukprot:comp10360_c0_seq1/m.5145 comp10360_c0_seq1/g.5145  ORF comp10360_c0_seq1/g.5145 comp10360_c0_seq1/m.5145 type:complete len:234 (-) comp10360_c0_seq1:187-888(-)
MGEGYFLETQDYVAAGFIALVLVIVANTPKFFDLESQFTFYASYHNNTVNKLIHLVCIWPIFWTSLVFFSYTSTWPSDATAELGINLNWSVAAAAIYAFYYFFLDARGTGVLGFAAVALCWVTANKFKETWYEQHIKEAAGFPEWVAAGHVALAVHVAAWLLQFVGHGAFEGRAPALLDNLAQALVMAPYFVLLELVFGLGFRSDFEKQVDQKVQVAIKEWKASKAATKQKQT